MDFAIHTWDGFITGCHKLVLLTNFKILEALPDTDCLILPDYGPSVIKNLLLLIYDPSHAIGKDLVTMMMMILRTFDNLQVG